MKKLSPHLEISRHEETSGLSPTPRPTSGDSTLRSPAPALAIALSFSVFLLTSTGCQEGPPMPLGFGPPLDNLFGLLLLVLLIGVIYRLLARRYKGRPENIPMGNAESIARERFARGEITEAEYTQIVRTLAAR